MEQLIDLIFENPFLLVIILGALFSLFGGKKKEEQQEQRQRQNQRTGSQQQRQQQSQQPMRTKSNPSQPRQQVKKKTQEKRAPQLSIEEQRARQMARFASNHVTEHHSAEADEKLVRADERRKTEIQNLTSSYDQKRFKKEFKQGLTREGLINSVIMAEVLGSPRARNPYESIVSKRRNGR